MLKLKLQYFGHLMSKADSLGKKPWCWERLKVGGEGDDRGWAGWMASLAQWTWVWVDSRSWWWTGRPGVLQFMGLQRVGQDWATELNWVSIMVQTKAQEVQYFWNKHKQGEMIWVAFLSLAICYLNKHLLSDAQTWVLAYFTFKLDWGQAASGEAGKWISTLCFLLVHSAW